MDNDERKSSPIKYKRTNNILVRKTWRGLSSTLRGRAKDVWTKQQNKSRKP